VVGGLDFQQQARDLARRPHVVVATPGRLAVRHPCLRPRPGPLTSQCDCEAAIPPPNSAARATAPLPKHQPCAVLGAAAGAVVGS
jgi:hypothetical protein